MVSFFITVSDASEHIAHFLYFYLPFVIFFVDTMLSVYTGALFEHRELTLFDWYK